ncbi:translation initiation factor IF-2-like isoform X1 [Canis lupus familiaris]|uniref:translation initiation factor IF-2-like isoform X1 n=1 Tax=Canis lupus familiaris TaxID=9615 RepID=UPI0018F5FC86|nr:translation initiation factor IF-2-like isoform X1 [Canis lupus familiaris]XP_038475334.1 translation initiation factor IF-2-like isoform X1 [Canis lupus familiaris]XP_038531077.1 translation initiation factor IF-2-like isoform X1 [Canis lupus familiaris]
MGRGLGSSLPLLAPEGPWLPGSLAPSIQKMPGKSVPGKEGLAPEGLLDQPFQQQELPEKLPCARDSPSSAICLPGLRGPQDALPRAGAARALAAEATTSTRGGRPARGAAGCSTQVGGTPGLPPRPPAGRRRAGLRSFAWVRQRAPRGEAGRGGAGRGPGAPQGCGGSVPPEGRMLAGRSGLEGTGRSAEPDSGG